MRLKRRCELKVPLMTKYSLPHFYAFQLLKTYFQKEFTIETQHFTVIKLRMNHWQDNGCGTSMRLEKLYVIVSVRSLITEELKNLKIKELDVSVISLQTIDASKKPDYYIFAKFQKIFAR